MPLALAFALAVNLLLITRFLYPEWLSGILVRLACWVGLGAWLFWVLRSVKELPELLQPRAVSDQPDRFPEARCAYLRGEWEEAEGVLAEVLAIESRDPPALLLLAGVYRHTERWEAAERLLEEIGRLEAADAWWLELEMEWKRLRRQAPDSGAASPDSEAAAPDSEAASSASGAGDGEPQAAQVA